MEPKENRAFLCLHCSSWAKQNQQLKPPSFFFFFLFASSSPHSQLLNCSNPRCKRSRTVTLPRSPGNLLKWHLMEAIWWELNYTEGIWKAYDIGTYGRHMIEGHPRTYDGSLINWQYIPLIRGRAGMLFCSQGKYAHWIMLTTDHSPFFF